MRVFLKHLTQNEIHATSRHGVLVPKTCAGFFPGLDKTQRNPRVEIGLSEHPAATFVYYNQRTRNEFRLISLSAEWFRKADPGDLLVIRELEDGRELHAEIIQQDSPVWNRLCAYTDFAGGAVIDASEFSLCLIDVSMDSFVIEIDPGTASAEEVAEVLSALSDLHRASGGLGLEFKADGSATVKAAGVSA